MQTYCVTWWSCLSQDSHDHRKHDNFSPAPSFHSFPSTTNVRTAASPATWEVYQWTQSSRRADVSSSSVSSVSSTSPFLSSSSARPHYFSSFCPTSAIKNMTPATKKLVFVKFRLSPQWPETQQFIHGHWSTLAFSVLSELASVPILGIWSDCWLGMTSEITNMSPHISAF